MGTAKDRILRYRPIKRKMVKDHHKETLAHALVAQPVPSQISSVPSLPQSTEWLLDSGASHHVTGDLLRTCPLILLMLVQILSPLEWSGDGTGMKISHIGSSPAALSHGSIHASRPLAFSHNSFIKPVVRTLLSKTE